MGGGIGCLGMIMFALLLFAVAGNSEELSTGFVWFCIIGIGVSGFVGLYLDQKRKFNFAEEIMKKLINTVKSVKGFNATQEFYSPNLESYIGLDESNNKVCIIENKHKNSWELSKSISKFDYESYVYSFDEIIQSEILRDGIIINKTDRGSQIGGAIIGGAIAGGVGAVIGGLGSPTESKSITNKLELQIAVNNTEKSSYKVYFLAPHDTGLTLKGDEEEKLYHWHNLLSHIINKSSDKVVSYSNNQLSISDELKKLAELKHQGILTDAEFNQEKQRLLSN
ncbi:SHOCT domain-containing protein [Rummeliibacillus sp. TYF-LIM-RU47]|uniref:SHOCT domain-containing protein n=1 Tax=Rummeliibacillus sp. TYF-LIM-RU47 TaxID=2608406 RepID=UPI00123A6112|nr:SHOCT domain-containing protein [Rummeliibacillus sp. TYF-LIM-RU47]